MNWWRSLSKYTRSVIILWSGSSMYGLSHVTWQQPGIKLWQISHMNGSNVGWTCDHMPASNTGFVCDNDINKPVSRFASHGYHQPLMDLSLKDCKSGPLNQHIAVWLGNSHSQRLFIWMGLFVVPSPEELYRLLLQHDGGLGPFFPPALILQPLIIVKDGITWVPVKGKWRDVNTDNM